MTFGEKVIEFNSQLKFSGSLPNGVQIMNPFRESSYAEAISREFYQKFFSDNKIRFIILGINPGRFGSGVTGIPFTDTIRLNEKCGIPFNEFRTYEPSSVFVYEVIEKYGGVKDFYGRFYIHAICPLGFTITGKSGKPVNYNYYDSKELTNAVYDFIVESLKNQLSFGIDTSIGFCLGTGKNEKFLRQLNEEHKFFSEIIALEHPRFIMQYKAGLKQDYVDKYISAFNRVR